MAPEKPECAMCGCDVTTCYVLGHNGNRFCQHCYYPTAEQAEQKRTAGWKQDKAGERYGGVDPAKARGAAR